MTTRTIDFSLVKEQASFSTILKRYRIAHSNRRGQVTVLCPFHDDKRPSLSVNFERNLFQCFGCPAKGSVLDFVSQMEKTSIPEAARIVADICGLPINGNVPASVRRPKRQNGRRNKPKEVGNKLLGFTILLDPKHPYLTKRGLTPALIEEFGLGYSRSHIHMSGRVCIPIHSVEGNLVAYAGRWASDDVPGKTAKYLLPRGFKKSEVLFNLHRVASADHVVLVEGYWSVFRLHALGIPAVALMGRTLSEAQEELLACSNAKLLTLLLDGDEPGREAAQAILPRLAGNSFVYHAELPEGEQPDTVDEKELRRLLWLS